MARRRRNREFDTAEAVVKAVLGLVILMALAVGGVGGFAKAFQGIVSLLLIAVVTLVVVALVALIGMKIYRSRRADTVGASGIEAPAHMVSARTTMDDAAGVRWDASRVRRLLEEIDWFQFEKFCAALLRADGYDVTRKGGAQPDGGVDLVVEKNGERSLVQCKHWKTWGVQEKVVREMLGSMTHFGVSRGAIYTLKGWTAPAARFAAQHGIALVDGEELSVRAIQRLSPARLDDVLRTGTHHCPKCEAPMVLRTGNFTPFLGCARYPQCRGKLNYSGAR